MNTWIGHLSLALAVFLSGQTSAISASAHSGRVGLWIEGRLHLVTQPLQENPFDNELFVVENLPEDLNKIEDNCYCYELSDPRFIYTHLSFHLTKQLTYYNNLLEQLNEAPIRGIKVRVEKAQKGEAPSADASGREIRLTYASNAMDETILAHELVHVMQFRVSNSLDGKYVPKGLRDDLPAFYEWFGIDEGVANTLAAIQLDQPKMAVYDWFDAFVDISIFTSYAALPSWFDTMKRKVNAPLYAKNYPSHVKYYREQMKIQDYKEWSDPYAGSTVFAQPLWEASKKFPKVEVEQLVIRSMKVLARDRTYPDYAHELLNLSEGKLHDFLKKQFQKRKLIP